MHRARSDGGCAVVAGELVRMAREGSCHFIHGWLRLPDACVWGTESLHKIMADQRHHPSGEAGRGSRSDREPVIKARAGLIAPPPTDANADHLAKAHNSTSAVCMLRHQSRMNLTHRTAAKVAIESSLLCCWHDRISFLPLMTYSALSATPLVHVHAPGWDFGDTAVRLLHVFLAAVLAICAANSPVVLYNMLLFFI